jgi:GAF domain-containing protein
LNAAGVVTPAQLERSSAAMAELLGVTRASRTTVRMRASGGDFPVIAEACGPGVRSLIGETGIDIRAAPTFIALERDGEMLIQGDLLAADPAPPAALIERYGARAQMLAPIRDDSGLVVIVSVHESRGPRAWSDADAAALSRAATEIADALGLEPRA